MLDYCTSGGLYPVDGRNSGVAQRQNADRLVPFPVPEKCNRNEYGHYSGNGADDHWLHE